MNVSGLNVQGRLQCNHDISKTFDKNEAVRGDGYYVISGT